MNIIYFGSPDISAQLLKKLLDSQSVTVSMAITQPDKPAGKSLQMSPTAVKLEAISRRIPLLDQSLKETASLELLKETIKKNDIHLGILFAYGALVKPEVISLFQYGIWNVHPSLLPCYRGPSPTAYPLMLGDKITGVTIMEIVEKLDAGPILGQKTIETAPFKDRSELESTMVVQAETLIRDLLINIFSGGSVPKTKQDESKSTYTQLLKKEDGYVSSDLLKWAFENKEITTLELPDIIKQYAEKYHHSISMNARDVVYNLYRGLSPWPGIWTTIETKQGKKRLKLCEIEIKDNKLNIQTVQLEGKNKVNFSTFNKAYNFINKK